MTKEEAAAAMSEDESDEDWGDVDQAPQKSSQSKSKKRKPVPGDESEECEDTEEEAEETGGSTDEGSDTEVEEPPPKAKPSASKKRKADPPPAKTPKKAPAKATKTAAKPKEGAPGWHPPLATQAPANKAPRKPPAPKGPTVFAETPLTKTDDGKYVREGMSAEQEVATYKEAMQAQADDWMKKSAKATTLATNGRNKNPKSTVQAFNGVDGAVLSTAAQELYAQEQAEKREPTPIELLQEAALKFAKATGVTPTVTVNLTGSPRAL